MKLFSSLTQLIGNTPLLEVPFLSKNPRVKIYGKLEGNNPGGSVKDRAAFFMMRKALESGQINEHTKIIEPTSGNTGIALSMIACSLNLNLELVMPESASVERVKTMKAYGAIVTLTDKERSMEGAIDYAREKVEREGYVMLDQFSNNNNKLSHYETTGPEIWRDTEGSITHFVSSMGTTGTIMGVSKFLKEKKPDVKIIGAQPMEGASIPGIRRWPKEYLPKIYEPWRVDQIVDVSEEQATNYARKMAKEQGIFSGTSSGGAAYIASQVGAEIDEGLIVFIVCDRGDRYLSTDLFE